MRMGKSNIEISQYKDKVIMNNYDHDGSGWTLAHGSTQYVNDQLWKNMATNCRKITRLQLLEVV